MHKLSFYVEPMLYFGFRTIGRNKHGNIYLVWIICFTTAQVDIILLWINIPFHSIRWKARRGCLYVGVWYAALEPIHLPAQFYGMLLVEVAYERVWTCSDWKVPVHYLHISHTTGLCSIPTAAVNPWLLSTCWHVILAAVGYQMVSNIIFEDVCSSYFFGSAVCVDAYVWYFTSSTDFQDCLNHWIWYRKIAILFIQAADQAYVSVMIHYLGHLNTGQWARKILCVYCIYWIWICSCGWKFWLGIY